MMIKVIKKAVRKVRKMPDEALEKACQTAENFILNEKHSNITNCITVGNGVSKHVGDVCHARLYLMMNRIVGEPLCHGESFARWAKEGDAGQEYYRWLCDPKESLFRSALSGVRTVRNPDNKIVGAILTDMNAPDKLCTQWMLAGRMPGEHHRAATWLAFVEAGCDPKFAFWATHFYSWDSARKKFLVSVIGHVGISEKDTLRRIMPINPSYGSKAHPFKEKDDRMMTSNYIWRDKAIDPVPYFRAGKIKSVTFGNLDAGHAFEPKAMFEGSLELFEKEKIHVA